MTSPAHNQAQALAADASLALKQGDSVLAISLYKKAAELEGLALRQVGEDKPRTQGILSVSYAALLFKANELELAEQSCHRLLADDALSSDTRDKLRALLESIWDQKVIAASKLRYSGSEIFVSLRGGQIGSGTAPLETAIHYLTGMTNLVYRVAEWQGEEPFRSRGKPPASVQALVQARATQPVAGSYRFSIRLVEPDQRSLFGDPLYLEPSAVSNHFISVLRSALSNDSSSLKQIVKDSQYRNVLLKLVRNIVPGSTNVREVEITASSDSAQSEGILLGNEAGRRIADKLKADQPVVLGARPVRIEGTLRAVHLDRNWLEIAQANGRHTRFRTKPDEVDELIGPMVNRHVIATGNLTKGDPMLLDIELSEGEPTPGSHMVTE